MTPSDLYRALTYDHRYRSVRRDQTVVVLAQHFQIPIAIATQMEFLNASDGSIGLIHPPSEKGTADRSEWIVAMVEPGDGTLLDPHHQLVMLAELMTDEDVGIPIGFMSRTPGVRIQRTNLSRKVDGLIGNKDCRVDDTALLELLHKLDRGWLMRIQMDAMVVVLFAGALRGIEGRKLRVQDWRNEEFQDGVTIRLAKSKTDPNSEGATIEIPYDLGGVGLIRPVEIVDRWIEVADLGPDDLLFPGMQGVGTRVDCIDRRGRPITAQALIARLGVLSDDLDLARRLTGHSGRRGFATAAADSGIELEHIARHLRHKRLETLQLYIERHSPGVHGRAVADGIVRALEADR